MKLPKLHLISEQDEDISENGSPERTRKESDGSSNSENLNSKPEADQLEMTTYPYSGEPTECVLECSECEAQDEVDGVTFAPLPDKMDLENEMTGVRKQSELPELNQAKFGSVKLRQSY